MIGRNSKNNRRTFTRLNFKPNQDQSVQIKKKPVNNQSKITNKQTNPTAQIRTTPAKIKSPAKLNSNRSPIRPPSSKLDNPNLELNCDKYERSLTIQNGSSSTGQERLKVSTLPNHTAETKNRFYLLERIETEESNNTRNVKKSNSNPS